MRIKEQETRLNLHEHDDDDDIGYNMQHRFRLGYSCERQVITVYQDKANSLDEGIIIDFSKAFNLVP